jgi:hypothetical protein
LQITAAISNTLTVEWTELVRKCKLSIANEAGRSTQSKSKIIANEDELWVRGGCSA